jgi:hypothetical protein
MKAKKTRKKAEKSESSKKSKEGVKEKRTKRTTGDSRKRANEEAMLEWRAKEEALKKEALDFYRQLKERNLPHFDGASIDFLRKRDPVVFIPEETRCLLP